MIKVMIIDDEEMTREGLKEFVSWSTLGMTVVGTADDGRDALEKFDVWEPDLLICDVRMPHMDGLELVRRLREMSRQFKIIFMSGYSDVEYLKTAIKLQAVQYVEKPVQITELEELLKHTGDEIRTAYEERKQVEQLRTNWDQNKPVLSMRLFQRMLSLQANDPAWKELKQQLQLLAPEYPLNGQWICTATALPLESDRAKWREEAITEAEALGIPILSAVVDGNGIALLALESNRHLESVALWANKLVNKSKDSVGLNKRAIGMGEATSSLSGIKLSFDQSLKALHFYFYRGWNSVLWYRELSQTPRETLLFDKNHFIAFEEALQSQQLEKAEELLNQAINGLLLFPSLDIEGVRKKLFRWYVAMIKIYPESMWEFENDELWSYVFVSGELFSIRQFMSRRIQIIRESREERVPNEKSVIREAVRYVQQHYHEDILISDIANHVYLTPTYLCLLFKKERGVSINEYMTQVRIEKAKQLLSERKLRLYEIANQVGYRDANYFSKVFRKVMGMNPSDYREKQGDLFR